MLRQKCLLLVQDHLILNDMNSISKSLISKHLLVLFLSLCIIRLKWYSFLCCLRNPPVRPRILSSMLESQLLLCWYYIFNDFDLSLDSSSELETRKRSGSELESRFNSRFLKNFKHKSQDSDECAALTNHLSLLIKRNVQFFDILSSPTPGIEPGLLRCFRSAKNSWIGHQQKCLPKLLDWAPAETRPAKLLD